MAGCVWGSSLQEGRGRQPSAGKDHSPIGACTERVLEEYSKGLACGPTPNEIQT